MKKAIAYFKKHPYYTSFIHFLGGIGIGILIASPLAGIHPIRWGIAFLLLGVLGHIYALLVG